MPHDLVSKGVGLFDKSRRLGTVGAKLKKHSLMTRLFTGLAMVMALALPPLAVAQPVDFGTDQSEWAFDGECDDPRFTGPGMTESPLLDADLQRDATDCRTAFQGGQIWLRDAQNPPAMQFGDDTSTWAFDGECDDPRFVGPGMTSSTLLASDAQRDATDCRTAFNRGRIWWRGGAN